MALLRWQWRWRSALLPLVPPPPWGSELDPKPEPELTAELVWADMGLGPITG
jgi:hypothetical protein